jgi:dTDP-4-dehydrorhamnose reductase
MSHKILITGSNGLLGQKLVNLFSEIDNFEVIALSRDNDKNQTAKNYTYYNIDLTNTEKVAQLINKVKPHYIINSAAMTNVDECEKEKKKCDAINIEAVKTLVNSAKEHNSHLIHISTDFIFDGEGGPYKEGDEPNPISHYGLSKLKSEEIIKKSDIKYTILRTILVYGIVDNMAKSNIVLWIKSSLENKQNITIVNDQYRMPTLADDLAQACLLSIQCNAYGVFHISSNELLSIYEIAIQVAKTFGLDTSYIKPISTLQLNQIAKRPPKTGFILEKSQKILKFPVLPFKNRLQVFKNQLIT